MGSGGKDAVKDAERKAAGQLADYKAQTETAKIAVEKQKQEYKDMDFTNPYADLGTENFAEDVTVNQQQAQFQTQQGAQQRSNIMQGLKGAAGGSGIAGLAQAMAGQGQLQNQQISASIGQQEQANQRLKIKGAERVAGVELQKAGGDAMVQQAESGRASTLLGMEYGAQAGINEGVQSAYGNQQSAIAMEAEMKAANQQMWGSIIGGVAGMAGSIAGAGIGAAGAKQAATIGLGSSDKRLKKNINKISESPSGLNIYSFEYKDSKYGKGLFQGVMSDEIPQEAVSVKDGYDMVDYSKLDVEFKQI